MGILNSIGSIFRMSRPALRKEEIVDPVPKTAGYAPVDTRWFRRPDDLPPMTWLTIEQMLVDPTIRLGLAMRAAPLRNAEFAYKEKGSEEWTPGIRASTPQVGAFVHRQFKKIWRELDALLIGQLYGWSACEVVHHLSSAGGTRIVEISRLVARHPRDCRALVKDGDICGVRFLRIIGEEQGHVDLTFPKAIFHRHAPQPGRHYGNTILEGAYSPFADKWGHGGALKLRRLVMQQSAISGRKLYYPDGVTDLPVGANGATVEVPNRDVARMIVEQMLAGGVSSFPSNRDADGNRLWEMEEAKALEGLQHILQYPKDLDVEELRGMEIPDDILTAEASGAWEGKKVPMMAFYGGLDSWLGTLVREICVQQMDYLVTLNFGSGHWYEAVTKPLAEQAMDQAKAGESKQQPPAPLQIGYNRPPDEDRPPQRMSLDAVQAVGQGVLDAAELVEAAKIVLNERTTK
jgi:hypothetical protein